MKETIKPLEIGLSVSVLIIAFVIHSGETALIAASLVLTACLLSELFALPKWKNPYLALVCSWAGMAIPLAGAYYFGAVLWPDLWPILQNVLPLVYLCAFILLESMKKEHFSFSEKIKGMAGFSILLILAGVFLQNRLLALKSMPVILFWSAAFVLILKRLVFKKAAA